MDIPIGVCAKENRYERIRKRQGIDEAERQGRQKKLGKALVLRYNEEKLRGGRRARAGGKPPKGQGFWLDLLVFPRKTFLGVKIWRFPLRNGRVAATTSFS